MKRILASIALAIVATLALAGCGEPIVGTVEVKGYSPGYYYPITHLSCNAQSVCTSTVTMSYMPDSYWLDVDTGKEDTERAYVNLGYWDQAEVGDHFDNTPEEER